MRSETNWGPKGRSSGFTKEPEVTSGRRDVLGGKKNEWGEKGEEQEKKEKASWFFPRKNVFLEGRKDLIETETTVGGGGKYI